MTPTAALIIIPGLCYFLAACLYVREGTYPLAVVYFGYFIGNCGLIWLDATLKNPA